jgi:hypothetical protein
MPMTRQGHAAPLRCSIKPLKLTVHPESRGCSTEFPYVCMSLCLRSYSSAGRASLRITLIQVKDRSGRAFSGKSGSAVCAGLTLLRMYEGMLKAPLT